MIEKYDVIVVGGGPAGAAVARRLADASSALQVLLLEGGGANDDEDLRSVDKRWTGQFNPSLEWGYKSTPQAHLYGRVIDIYRGKGLGGSSATNFSCWLLGHKEDFNEWAEQVNDPVWKWDGPCGVKERFRKIEKVHSDFDDKTAMYISREAHDLHSKQGAVDVSYNHLLGDYEINAFEAARESGLEINGDMNSGDPTGFGMGPATFYNGLRTTARTAYLSLPPPNLSIKTNTVVSNVIFDESKRVVGVKTLGGQTYHSNKEVILSAGSIDTPKILLLSGIGPAADLSALSIPVIQDLPVGKNLRDHCLVSCTILLKPQAPVQVSPEDALLLSVPCPTAWLSSPVVKESSEFASLDSDTQAYLLKVPSYEFLMNPFRMSALLPPLEDDDEVITFIAAVMNAQSTGSVKLASADPSVPPLIDTNYLSHPYDRRVAIEALRAITKYSQAPTFAAMTQRQIEGPPADADDDAFWEHCKLSVQPVYHFASTCKMGRKEDETAVVDADFKVKGVNGLRVVDVSVVPVLPNNHTQSTAYLIGETAAEKIIKQYCL